MPGLSGRIRASPPWALRKGHPASGTVSPGWDWNPAPGVVPPAPPASAPWGPREQACGSPPGHEATPQALSHGGRSLSTWATACVPRHPGVPAACSPLTVQSEGGTAQPVRSRAANALAWETLPVMRTAPGDRGAPSWPKRAATPPAWQGIEPKVVASSHFSPRSRRL